MAFAQARGLEFGRNPRFLGVFAHLAVNWSRFVAIAIVAPVACVSLMQRKLRQSEKR